MIKRIVYLIAVLTACGLSNLRAQTTNTPEAAAATNAMAGMAMTTAPAAAPASTANNDPGGGATGGIGDVSGSGGSYSYPAFQVSAPAELSADDKKDTNKVSTYNDAKKAFDDYTKQAAAEPLAVKVADAVGHYRISIHFVCTLLTCILVMLIEPAFAL